MSQNNKTVRNTALSVLLLGAMTAPVTANAAVATPEGRSVVYKTSLSAIEGLDARILDWRNPSLEFTFDASDTDWTDGVELLLSADPLGKVNRRTPLMVQFNNGKPTPVITRGQGFDARIQLDAARIRPRNNRIRFTYNTPAGAECLSPEHGGWRLDFKNSLVIVKARAKARNLDIREIEAKLSNPATAPKSVRLLARGSNTAKLQALAAQGVGLRMDTLPEFKTRSGGSEFEVILGRRDQLHGWVSDEKILNSSGPRLMVHRGRPMRLIITGDTDAEVMSGAKAFATYRLPNAHRPTTSPGELDMQMPLGADIARVEGTENLSELSGSHFENSWGPRPQKITFNVNDPMVSSGELLLRLASDNSVAASSRVSVDLNGKSLGFTSLDKSRKSVAFKIPEGTLQGTHNILAITPELEIGKISGCNFVEHGPGFYLGNGSKLKIQTAEPSPIAELSKLTANGGAFSIAKAGNTAVMLPASSSRDYNASLKIMAKLAKSSGHGWTEANYLRSANLTAVGPDKNVLIIGPSSSLNRTIRDAAPKALKSALKGQSLDGMRVASIDRIAASDEDTALRLYAERQASAGRIRNGGVAAMFPSPNGEGKVMGVITNTPGQSFSSAAGQLLKPQAWHNMEGSVARWDKSKVLMAQTAMAVPGFVGAEPKESVIDGFKWSGINWPTFDLPKFDKEAVEFGEINTSTLRAKFNNLKTSGKSIFSRSKKEQVVTPRLKPEHAKVPELRGFSKISAAPTGTKLKTWAADALTNLRTSWNKLEAGKSVKALQSKVTPIGDVMKDKLGLDPSVNSNALATMIIAILAALFLLLGLMRPSRGRR